jgi:large subunit ribosomal protein L29
MKENADKARALDAAEIAKRLSETAEQSFRLRFQLAMGQTDGVKKIRQLRKERARMLTVQRERELGKSEAPAEKVSKQTAKAVKAPAAKKPTAASRALAALKGAAGKKPAAAKKTSKG